MNPLSCCAVSLCEVAVFGGTAAGTAEILEICRGMPAESIQRLLAGVEIGLRIVEIGLRIAELTADYSPELRITSPQIAIRYCLQQFGRLARESKDRTKNKLNKFSGQGSEAPPDRNHAGV